MIGMQVEIVTTTGRHRVSITPRIQVEFERFHKTGVAKAFTDDMRMEHVYWMAWKSAIRAGSIADIPFDEFLDALVDVELITDEPPSPPLV